MVKEPPPHGLDTITSLHLNSNWRPKYFQGCINALGRPFRLNCVMPKQSMGQQCPSLSAALSHTSGQAGESSCGELKRLRLKECRHVEL